MPPPPPICIPDAHGVPGAGGPPDWWLLGSGPAAIDELRRMRSDPRWRGAARFGIPGTGVATGNLCTVRALRSGQHLYLAVHVNPARDVDPDSDRVWIAYHRDGQAAQMVRIP